MPRSGNRWDLINYLIENRGYKRYLEIGVSSRQNFNQVQCEHKESVDPNGLADHNVPSDDFFESLDKDVKFDIIFIDGLHIDAQVERDIENSLRHLSPGGTIMCHDCLPAEEYQQREEMVPGMPWAGTVWKCWAKLRATRDDLEMYVVNTDWGCGILRPGTQEKYLTRDPCFLDWSYYRRYRHEMMNIISTTEFWDREACES